MTSPTFMTRHKSKLVPIVAFATLAIAALIYKDTLTAWFSGKPVSANEGKAVASTAGSINIATSLNPDPPKQGDNMAVVVLTDSNGKPLTDATVEVNIWMPAMGSMPEMRTKGKVRPAGDGRFEAPFDLAMAGSWNVDVLVKAKQGDLKAEYTLNVGQTGLTKVNVTGSAAEGDEQAAKPTYSFADPALDALRGALDAYETLRTKLAADDGAGLATSTSTIAEAMTAAKAGDPAAPPELAKHFSGAVTAAKAVGEAGDIETARERFADLSKAMVALVSADERLAKGKHVFMCPMKKGFNQWVQPSETLTNPYMGTEMSTCGSELEWKEVGGDGEAKKPAQHNHDPDDIAYYTCPMDTWVKTSDPGQCPVCSMDLQPVTKQQVKTGELAIDHRRRQLIGVRTALVRKEHLVATIKAIGEVTYDESRLADVTIKYRGWVKKLRVSRTGQKVSKGQTLFTVYSPEVYAAQQEYLFAIVQQRMAKTESAKQTADALFVGARERLRLWDVTNSQLKQIAARGKPMQYLPVSAPATGYVVEKNLVEGGAFQAGQRLFRIANLDKVWVEAELYEQDIPLIRVGQPANITLSHIPGKTFEGKVAFIYPYLDRKSRTVRARIEMPNHGLMLKPDMFADVELKVDRGEKLLVPESAVIYSGPRRIVFLDLGKDKFRPQLVEVGLKSDGYFEVVSGLEKGDKVVISGNFLLSSESRLKSATGLW